MKQHNHGCHTGDRDHEGHFRILLTTGELKKLRKLSRNLPDNSSVLFGVCVRVDIMRRLDRDV